MVTQSQAQKPVAVWLHALKRRVIHGVLPLGAWTMWLQWGELCSQPPYTVGGSLHTSQISHLLLYPLLWLLVSGLSSRFLPYFPIHPAFEVSTGQLDLWKMATRFCKLQEPLTETTVCSWTNHFMRNKIFPSISVAPMISCGVSPRSNPLGSLGSGTSTFLSSNPLPLPFTSSLLDSSELEDWVWKFNTMEHRDL